MYPYYFITTNKQKRFKLIQCETKRKITNRHTSRSSFPPNLILYVHKSAFYFENRDVAFPTSGKADQGRPHT